MIAEQENPSIPCIGCENPAEFPLKSKRYCRSCFVSRMEQMEMQERQFHLWRIIRNVESEFWAIGHPASKTKRQLNCDRVGEVWVAFDSMLKALHVYAYLEPGLNWDQSVPILLPTGIVIDDTYLDVLARTLNRFFEVGFNVENRFFEYVFLTGPRKRQLETTNPVDGQMEDNGG